MYAYDTKRKLQSSHSIASSSQQQIKSLSIEMKCESHVRPLCCELIRLIRLVYLHGKFWTKKCYGVILQRYRAIFSAGKKSAEIVMQIHFASRKRSASQESFQYPVLDWEANYCAVLSCCIHSSIVVPCKVSIPPEFYWWWKEPVSGRFRKCIGPHMTKRMKELTAKKWTK